MVKGVKNMAVIELNADRSEQMEQWIARIGKNDSHALEQLYHAASPAVYSFALSILKNRHDAEDVLHDCFVAIFSSADGYRPKGKPMAWILTIARNLSLKRLQEHSRHAPLPEDDWNAITAQDLLMTVDDRAVIEACMVRLSDEERQIVVLHAVAGFRHREIAAMLDLALPTVLSKYHRAIKKMKAEFEGECMA